MVRIGFQVGWRKPLLNLVQLNSSLLARSRGKGSKQIKGVAQKSDRL
jgi:hypothetical protein